MAVDNEFRQIKDIIVTVNELAVDGKWVVIEQLLDEIDYTAPDVILVAWLRSTYPMRIKLYNWQDTVYKVKDEFDRRGNKGPQVLKGLL